MLALVVILLLLLGWALIAGRLARYSVTAPLALLVAGVVLTAGQDPVFIFDIEFKAAEQIVEVILAILQSPTQPKCRAVCWAASRGSPSGSS